MRSTFSERLQAARLNAGLAQSELAALAGSAPRKWAASRRAASTLPADSQAARGGVLGESVGWLLLGRWDAGRGGEATVLTGRPAFRPSKRRRVRCPHCGRL